MMSAKSPEPSEAYPPSGPSLDVEEWRRTGKFMTCGGMGRPGEVTQAANDPQPDDFDQR